MCRRQTSLLPPPQAAGSVNRSLLLEAAPQNACSCRKHRTRNVGNERGAAAAEAEGESGSPSAPEVCRLQPRPSDSPTEPRCRALPAPWGAVLAPRPQGGLFPNLRLGPRRRRRSAGAGPSPRRAGPSRGQLPGPQAGWPRRYPCRSAKAAAQLSLQLDDALSKADPALDSADKQASGCRASWPRPGPAPGPASAAVPALLRGPYLGCSDTRGRRAGRGARTGCGLAASPRRRSSGSARTCKGRGQGAAARAGSAGARGRSYQRPSSPSCTSSTSSPLLRTSASGPPFSSSPVTVYFPGTWGGDGRAHGTHGTHLPVPSVQRPGKDESLAIRSASGGAMALHWEGLLVQGDAGSHVAATKAEQPVQCPWLRPSAPTTPSSCGPRAFAPAVASSWAAPLPSPRMLCLFLALSPQERGDSCPPCPVCPQCLTQQVLGTPVDGAAASCGL